MCRSPQSLRLLLALPCAALLACRATSEPGSLMCSAAPPPVAASSAAADVWKARRLSRVELARTFDALLGKVPASLAQLAQDDAENAAPASFEIDLYRQIAAEAAAPGARLLLARWGCAGDLPCLQAALAGWLESAFRGPLSDDERAEYFALLPSAGTERALRELLELVFQSPRFLYVIERGVAGDGSEARRELSAWELAARLSYLLWSQPPDDALREDARSGRLYEPAVLRAQALRLLHDPRAARTIGAVLQHWSAPELETLAKAANVYPEWDPQLREAMIEQFREFAALVLDKDYDFRAVLTTRWLPVDERLAGLSGTEASSGGWQLVESHEPRFGLLTLPGVLAANARADDSSPVARGLFIRQNLLCQIMPPPPPGVPPLPAATNAGAGFRERFAAHTARPVCASCHSLMDPLGFPFEIYDGVGRLRAHAERIDTAGKLDGVEAPASFEDLAGLVGLLVEAPEVSKCWAGLWTKRALGVEDGDLAERLGAEVRGGLSLAGLLVELISTDQFRTVTRPAEK